MMSPLCNSGSSVGFILIGDSYALKEQTLEVSGKGMSSFLSKFWLQSKKGDT